MRLARFIFILMGGLFPLLFGCQISPKAPARPAVARFYIETSNAFAGTQQVVLPLSGASIVVASTPVLIETDITTVDLVQVDMGQCIRFTFSPEASRSLYRITASNNGRRLVLTINGKPVGVRIISGAEGSGQWMTFTEINNEELPEMVVRLRETTLALQTALAKR